MKSIRLSQTLAVALFATLAVAGCKKQEAAPPPVVAPAPAPSPAPMAATAAVTGVVVGNATDANGQVSMPVAEFAGTDTITASITTSISQPMATVSGTLSAKWLYEDGQVVSEESKTFGFSGPGVTNFQISKPDGWPAGDYTLQVSLDGAQVESRTFTVR